jgi:predicted ATPase
VSLIRQVIAQPEDELYRLLASLQHKEFLYEQPAFPESEYRFKHALTQEVAYGTVLQEQRKRLHERTGHALEALYTATLPEHYSDLAHHYSRSGNTQKAVDYLQLAGQQAVQRAAYIEAINHLTSAVELLKTLPETIERKQQELALQLTRGAPLMATKGYSAPEVKQVYTRARELCQQVGETPQLFQAIWGLWFFYRIQGDLKTVRELGEQILSLVQSQQDTALLLQGHFAMGASLLWMGDFALAQTHLDQGLALYDFDRHRSQAFLSGFDPGALCLTDAALTLWFRGYADQARKRIHEAFRLAQRLSHPESLVLTQQWSAMFHQLCGEVYQTSQQAEATKHLAVEHGLALWEGWATPLLGWAVAQQGREEEGIGQMRAGIAAAGEYCRSYYLAFLAEGYGKVGQVEEGLDALAEALALVNKNEERWYEAELYRIKGELTLQSSVQRLESSVTDPRPLIPDPQDEAEACFLKALEIARKQQAKSLELRATISLAQLWQQQGKTAEARQMLVEVYGWFTEGFDTKDLQEAKALLEELSH